MSWTPSDGAELYFIIYEHVLIPGMMVVQGTLDSATVRLDPDFSMPGSPFSFMLVAHTALPSVEVGPVDITLGIYYRFPIDSLGYSLYYTLLLLFRKTGCQALCSIGRRSGTW